MMDLGSYVSGISCLSAAASGVNPFKESFLIAVKRDLFRPGKAIFSRGAAVQLGGKNIDLYKNIIFKYANISIYRDNIITVDEKPSRNIIFGGDKDVIRRVLSEMGFAFP